MEDLILKQSIISTILLLNSKANPYNFDLKFDHLKDCTYENLENIRDLHLEYYNKQK